jgi:type II secretory pathway component GspD/PulD (secretin)
MIRFQRLGVSFLFAGMLGVMALAAGNFAQGQGKTDKAKAKVEDGPKLVPPGRMDWNKTKIAFEMSGKEWQAVFQWLADKSGMPFSSKYKVPDTFTFSPPAGSKYTLLEIFDIVNEVLQTQHKFTLLRSEVTLSLVPADVDPPDALVPLITRAELAERGRTEIVQMVVEPRSGLDAVQSAPDLKRALGTFGHVTPLESNNKWIVRGVVASLRRILPEFEKVLGPDGSEKNDHTLTYQCKFIRASTAEAVITKALGAQQIVERTKGPQDGPDSKKGQPTTTKQIRNHNVTSDRATNTVIITGPQSKLDEAKAILASLDKAKNGDDKGLLPTSPHQFRYHELAGGGADAMMKMLNEIYKADDSIRISVATPARLFVWADPQTHQEINGIVSASSAPNIPVETVSINLVRQDAYKFADSLKKMFPNSDKGSPFIEADIDQNAIRLRGTKDEIQEVRTVIKILDGAVEGVNAKSQWIILDKGSGATVAEAVSILLPKLRDVKVNLELPGKLDDNLKVDFNKKVDPKADSKPRIEDVPLKKTEPKDKDEVNPFQKKPAPTTRLTPDKLREVIYSNDTYASSAPVLFDATEEKHTPKPLEKDEKLPEKKKKGTITISGFGNRILITGDDPEAVDLARQIIRILVNTEAGPGDFEVINLKYASAVEVAKILDEAFNGPKGQPQGGGGGGPRPGGGFPGLPQMLGGLLGGGGAPQGRIENMRVVADPATNALLIRAKPIDMLTIRRLLAQQLDVRNLDSERIARTFIIGPLKNATAVNVASILESVYKDSMSRTSDTIAQTSPGFQFFQQQRTAQPVNGQAALLAVGVDNTTNSLVVQCPTTLYNDVKKLVDDLDTAAGDNKMVVKIVSVKDIDPAIVQQAVDAISGRATVANRQPGGFNQGNMNPGAFGAPGRFGNPGFGNPGFGNPGFGNPGFGNPGFGNPGFGNPGIFNPGGGGGPRGPGGGGGPKGGGKTGRAFDGGSDFFVSRVMDDPSVNILYDPSEEQDEYLDRFAEYVKRPIYTANPLVLSFQDEPKDKDKGKGELVPLPRDKDDVNAPRLPVTIEPIPDLGIVIIRAQNQADLAAVIQILELIRRQSQPALIEIELVPVRFGDPTQITDQLNQLYNRVTLTATSTTILGTGVRPGGTVQPGFGPTVQQAQTTSTAAVPSNIVLLPQQRLGGILVAASKARMPDIKKQIQMLDQRYSDVAHVKPYPLKRAVASRVGTSLTLFYNTKFTKDAPPATNQIRITWDDGTNTVFVQAPPADLEEFDRIINYIDTNVPGPLALIQVVPLHNAVATDLASLLQVAIANGVLTLNTVNVPIVQTPGLTASAGTAPTQFGQLVPFTKESRLRFVPSQAKNGKMIDAHVLEDIRIFPDVRTNALVVTAPEESMALVLALIRDLDVQPLARSEINIFTLKKSDSTQMAIMLQQLFLGSGGVGAKATTTTTPTGGTGTTPKPLSFTIQTTTPEGAPIIDLRVTVDERTNSLIVAGSQNDLRVVETIIARIEDANAPERRNDAVRLRNSQATDVANAVSTFLTNVQTLEKTYGQETNSLGLVRDVIVVAEPISNSLLISATPAMFDQIISIISKIDTAPAQVVIQVLIAEVTMNGSEEFGMEIGLQNPLSFARGFIPGTSAPIYATTSNGSTPTGTIGVPGFWFNNPPTNAGEPIGTPGLPGFAGTTNLGVGRVSPINNVPGFTFTANSDVVSVLIRALKVQQRINVLSRPQLMTLDNQTGIIQVVTNTPVIQGAAVVSATGVVTNPPITTIPLGVTLQVTPRITPDGRVIMRVIPEVSALDSTTFPLGNGQFGTSYKVQHLETTVAAGDGETILLGGLMSKADEKNENKVPWLGDLPGIGAAFRYRNYQYKKTELVIIMTPHIVRNSRELQQIKDEELRRIHWRLCDVNRVHGDPDACKSGGCEPFRIYRDGRPGTAEYAGPCAGPTIPPSPRVPAPPVQSPPTSLPPIESGPAPTKALFKGGLIQSMMNRQPAETVVYDAPVPTSPPNSMPPITMPPTLAMPTVEYARPSLPPITTPSNQPTGPVLTMPADITPTESKMR